MTATQAETAPVFFGTLWRAGAAARAERLDEARRRMRLRRADFSARVTVLEQLTAITDAIAKARRLDVVAAELHDLADRLERILQPYDPLLRCTVRSDDVAVARFARLRTEGRP